MEANLRSIIMMKPQDDEPENQMDKMEQGQSGGDEPEDERSENDKEDELEKNQQQDEKPSLKEDDDKDGVHHDTVLDDSLRHGRVDAIPLDLLDPPMTRRERFRDYILRWLDRPEFQIAGLVVLFLVIADGALFFFFLMGWQTLCDDPSRTDCSPRNEVYNVSVQLLTWLFTYMATVSMPWRCANFIQIFGCGKRDNGRGMDLYGRPTNEVWFHIAWGHKSGIIICLMLNCLLQYANQATRLIFYNYEKQDTHPGNKWVNIFFGTSFAFAGIGFLWSVICTERLRKQHPGRFGPGVVTLLKQYWKIFWSKLTCHPLEEEEEEELDEDSKELRLAEEQDDEEDPTRYRRFNILGAQRAGLRLFGM